MTKPKNYIPDRQQVIERLRAEGFSPAQITARLRPSMAGDKNPNYKDAGHHICQKCGVDFFAYNKTRKYCSPSCYAESKPRRPKKQIQLKLVKVQKPRTGRVVRSTTHACLHCGSEFLRFPSQTRIYCSYACHLASGGAFRAGLASSKATMKYGAKKDANHSEIFDELRKHCAVYDFSAAGHGLPDGCAWVNGAWHLFDVKNPKTGYGRRGLNKVQKKWLSQWCGGPVYLIYTVEEAERFGCGDMNSLKAVTPESLLEAA